MALFGLPLGSLAQEKPKQDDKDKPKQDERNTLKPEEVQRRKDEAYKEAEAAYKKIRSWTAKIKMGEVDPFSGTAANWDGSLWMKIAADESRMLYWGLKQWELQLDVDNQERRVELGDVRSLAKVNDLRVALDARKVLELYDLAIWDILMPQLLVRDGLTKRLEEAFEVEIFYNPKYVKTETTAVDWAHLGFNNKEEWEAWFKNKKAKDAGLRETKVSEFDTFKDQEEKYRKNNKRNKEPGQENAEHQHYYIVFLTPTHPRLKREVTKVMLKFRPGDFLPVYLRINRVDDRTFTLQIEGHEANPVGEKEIKDERFQLEAPGYAERWPQKG